MALIQYQEALMKAGQPPLQSGPMAVAGNYFPCKITYSSWLNRSLWSNLLNRQVAVKCLGQTRSRTKRTIPNNETMSCNWNWRECNLIFRTNPASPIIRSPFASKLWPRVNSQHGRQEPTFTGRFNEVMGYTVYNQNKFTACVFKVSSSVVKLVQMPASYARESIYCFNGYQLISNFI